MDLFQKYTNIIIYLEYLQFCISNENASKIIVKVDLDPTAWYLSIAKKNMHEELQLLIIDILIISKYVSASRKESHSSGYPRVMSRLFGEDRS